MTDAAFLELLASYEAALETANRSLTIARSLAEGYRSGVRPPDAVLEAYLTSFERDQAQPRRAAGEGADVQIVVQDALK